MEALRRDTDYGHGVSVHLYLFANNAGVRVEALRPVSVSQDHYLFRADLFCFRSVDQPSLGRLQAKTLKVISADVAKNYGLGSIFIIQPRQVKRVRQYVRKSVCLRPHILKVRVGQMDEGIAAFALATKNHQ